MSIATEIQNYNDGLLAAYGAVSTKGGTVPAQKNLDNLPTAINSISGGGGGDDPTTYSQKEVFFINYNGDIVYAYTKDEFNALTVMPTVPDRTAEGLTAEGWNWSLADAKTHVANMGYIYIAPQYVPTDGKAKIYVVTQAGQYDLYFNQSASGATTIDWGDGSQSEILSGSGSIIASHNYTQDFEGWISLDISSGTLTNTSGKSFRNDQVDTTVRKFVWANNFANANGGTFFNMSALEEVVMNSSSIISPSNVGSLIKKSGVKVFVVPNGSYTGTFAKNAFDYARRLKYISFSKTAPVFYGQTQYATETTALLGVTFPIGNKNINFYTSASLKRITIPPDATHIILSNATSLAKVDILDGVTTITQSAFNSCYALEEVIFPSTITSIGNTAFYKCYACKLFDFSSFTSIPTLGTNAFPVNDTNTSLFYSIVVPDALYDTWIAEANWSSYASRIVKASEYQAEA